MAQYKSAYLLKAAEPAAQPKQKTPRFRKNDKKFEPRKKKNPNEEQ